MLQLVYISTVVDDPDTAAILRASRRNNGRAGITGLLYCDGRRFLQALEGEHPAVEAAFERIRRDPRHRAVVVLSRRDVAEREFGPWAMAERGPDGTHEGLLHQVAPLLAGASPNVRGTFDGFMRLGRAA
ncbi:BLUF domain-containing protein [Sphingomonas bacterium]|uniref:BLUF domain-containing protein n=1 Tax=Sphingomonas bacterium TaxID=1895847 RepID=UPI001575EF78|nr:BLUF domain-containing protein [Sphingomonas bacterium]